MKLPQRREHEQNEYARVPDLEGGSARGPAKLPHGREYEQNGYASILGEEYFMPPGERRGWPGRMAGVVALLAVAGVAVAVLHRPGEESHRHVQQARMLELPMMGNCTFWGDPHIATFDGGRTTTVYGEGEFYIVRAPASGPAVIDIQGRYMGTEYTAGLAATNKIIVGGSFLRGHTIAVGDLEDGQILIDGEAELTSIPSSYSISDLGNITYSSEGDLVDAATDRWEKRVVKMVLPGSVVIEVFRWTNYLDLRITMPQQEGGQDGTCGNFNGDASDDGDEDVFRRIGARVPEGELLFNHRAPERVSLTMDELLEECEPQTLKHAKKECERDLAKSYKQPSLMVQQSCWLDICYQGQNHLLREAQRLEKSLAAPGAASTTPPPGEAMD